MTTTVNDLEVGANFRLQEDVDEGINHLLDRRKPLTEVLIMGHPELLTLGDLIEQLTRLAEEHGPDIDVAIDTGFVKAIDGVSIRWYDDQDPLPATVSWSSPRNPLTGRSFVGLTL